VYSSPHNPDSDENIKAIVNRWMKLWQGGDISAVDSLHTPDFIDHSSAGRESDREGFKKGLIELYRAFPDFFARIEDVVIDERSGKAAIRWSAVGTHQGVFMGILPTGERIAFQGIEIIMVKNGRITDRWGEWDEHHIMEQIGGNVPGHDRKRRNSEVTGRADGS